MDFTEPCHPSMITTVLRKMYPLAGVTQHLTSMSLRRGFAHDLARCSETKPLATYKRYLLLARESRQQELGELDPESLLVTELKRADVERIFGLARNINVDSVFPQRPTQLDIVTPRTLQVREMKSSAEVEQIFSITRNLEVEKVFPPPTGSDVMPDDLTSMLNQFGNVVGKQWKMSLSAVRGWI
ncbi:hypothetical protein CNMCM5793_009342 [Aspergillus hiratsukae]|uniref:Uncharacterized protein n=1 Tax=Aspergillus hiratsukae TaxID=1194566 RepID=A0A8H6QB87_9EURO|nr:hypothetical protein CNMCM5793_009342 [Aspergillus hiratsukae]KAF7169202.1 hypothetical protein CNMCM6106_004151 [Aspergillus hiratsukae]